MLSGVAFLWSAECAGEGAGHSGNIEAGDKAQAGCRTTGTAAIWRSSGQASAGSPAPRPAALLLQPPASPVTHLPRTGLAALGRVGERVSGGAEAGGTFRRDQRKESCGGRLARAPGCREPGGAVDRAVSTLPQQQGCGAAGRVGQASEFLARHVPGAIPLAKPRKPVRFRGVCPGNRALTLTFQDSYRG